MTTVLPLDIFFIELLTIIVGYSSIVAQKDVHSFFLAEDSSAYAAFASAEYHEIFCHFVIFYG